MLWVRSVQGRGPSNYSDWEFGNSCVDCTSVLGVPNHESVIFTDCSYESIIWTESKSLHANLHSLQNGDWFFGLEVPHDNWSIRSPLENGSFLPRCNDVAGT